MKPLVLSAAVIGMLIAGFSGQAYANQQDVLLLPDLDKSVAEFDGVRFIEIKYPQGSSIAKLFNGKIERIEFTVNGTYNSTDGSGIDKVIQAINTVLLTENKSPVVVENASLRFSAALKGYSDGAQLAYTTSFKPLITRYVLQKTGDNNQPAIVDLNWRTFAMNDPILITTEKYGTFDVNHPIGLVQLLFPELAEKLTSSAAKEIMEDPIVNFDRFGLSMKSWHYLFDVTGKQLERYGVFKEGEGKTVSIYSIGESSFREGTYLSVEKDAIISIDGDEVKLHAKTPPPSGQITIAGYSKVEEKDGNEFALVYPNSPSIGIEFGFQFQVLLVLAGLMGAIAVVVLIKARK